MSRNDLGAFTPYCEYCLVVFVFNHTNFFKITHLDLAVVTSYYIAKQNLLYNSLGCIPNHVRKFASVLLVFFLTFFEMNLLQSIALLTKVLHLFFCRLCLPRKVIMASSRCTRNPIDVTPINSIIREILKISQKRKVVRENNDLASL